VSPERLTVYHELIESKSLGPVLTLVSARCVLFCINTFSLLCYSQSFVLTHLSDFSIFSIILVFMLNVLVCIKVWYTKLFNQKCWSNFILYEMAQAKDFQYFRNIYIKHNNINLILYLEMHLALLWGLCAEKRMRTNVEEQNKEVLAIPIASLQVSFLLHTQSYTYATSHFRSGLLLQTYTL